MIISHKYQFIFIKTRKTAGTSIEVFLSPLCDEEDTFTPISPLVPPHERRNYQGRWNLFREMIGNGGWGAKKTLSDFLQGKKFYNHLPARLAQFRMAPSVWQNYFKFCVERNPWNKTLSRYHMVKSKSNASLTLDQYLADGRLALNAPIYTDGQGKPLVDRILKYERLTEELEDVFGQLGVSFEGDLGVRAKGDYRQDKRPYQEVLTPQQRELITQAFAQEIQMNDYTF
jgi:hypothetical protein